MMRLEISDWVQGKTSEDELIRGFVESIDRVHGIARVNVVQSDHEAAIGTIVGMREQWLKRLEVISMEEQAPLLNFIDMALATRDEEWFAELSEKLAAVKQYAGKDVESLADFQIAVTNRLGVPGITE